jgi:hypothetical protein
MERQYLISLCGEFAEAVVFAFRWNHTHNQAKH